MRPWPEPAARRVTHSRCSGVWYRDLPRVGSLNFWFSMPSVVVNDVDDIEVDFHDKFFRLEEPQALPEEHKIGVIVVDHGSRRAEANRLLNAVSARANVR